MSEGLPLPQLPAATTLGDADLIYVVDDVAGTPASKKLTGANLKGAFSSVAVEVVGSENSDLSGTDGSATVAVPSGVEDGDLLVASMFHRDLNVNHPAGWEVVRQDKVAGFDQWHVLLTRIADGEPANYSWSDGGSRVAVGVVALRSDWLLKVGESEWASEADVDGGTWFDAPSVDTPVAQTVLLSLLTTVTAEGSWDWSTPTAMDPLWGATAPGDRLHAAFEKVDKGATGVRRWDEDSFGTNAGVGALSVVIYRVSPGTNGGGSVAVDDDGTEVTAEASRLNFGTGLSVTDDGAGAVTVNATSDDPGSHTELVGDGIAVTFDVTHSLGTSAIVVAAWEVASGERLSPSWLILDDNTVRVTFGSAPATDDVRVVVLSSGAEAGGLTLMDEVVLGAATATIDLDIDSDAVEFVVHLDVPHGFTSLNVGFRPNNDTGSNYRAIRRNLDGSSGVSASNNTTANAFIVNRASSLSDGSFPYMHRLRFRVASDRVYFQGEGLNAGTWNAFGGSWHGTLPMTFLHIYVAFGEPENFPVGTSASAYRLR